MASSFQLVFLLGSIIGLLTIKDASAQSQNFEAAASNCLAPCPPGWTQFGSRCFIFYYQSRTWTEAEVQEKTDFVGVMQQFCISIGGNLASIHNLDENNFISEMVQRVTGYTRDTWIGGYDAVSENTWLWSDGSTFEFTNWHTNQPDNSGSQNCLEINYGGNQWNDISCSMRMPFVCSRDI